MFGTFAALQKILTIKAKRKKNQIVFMAEKKNKLCVIKIYNITEKSLCVIKIYNITEKSK